MRSTKLFYFIAFLCGVVVMAMEISFSRLLAPYFGTSLFVWTNLIGAVLIALAVGYYVGGYLAERRPELSLLLKLIFFSGLAFLFVPWLVSLLGSQAVLRWRETYNIYSLLVWWIPAVGVLVLPLAVLGMASPFLMKIYSLQNPHFGRVSGGVSFAFTIGSILGVYLPTFWLIPSYGTRATVMVFAAPLVLLGIFGWKRTAPKALFIVLAAGTAALVSLSPILPSFPDLRILAQEESPYNFIRVAEDAAGNRYMMFNAGLGIQSIYSSGEPLVGYYYDYYNLLPAFFPEEKEVRVLVLGLAGGTIPRQLDHFYGGMVALKAVEIDPEVVEISRRYFGIDSVKMDVVNEDARVFLQSDHDKYDIVIVDAFQNEFEIPWTLTTEEFWRLVRGRLRDGGIMAMNLIGRSHGDVLGERLNNTQAKVFDHTYVAILGDEERTNKLILASDRPLIFSGALFSHLPEELRGTAVSLSRNISPVTYDQNEPILTDDRAPVEILTSSVLFGSP